ncbi:pectate lyase family protein [Rhizorhapis sp. SPR117]|uniref:pectate lyase family protein n=1 Tax=Rhizorhapis sp. SPR117 TaxID=2912611 RepID=UPI001F1BE775|nr:pectate lyase [Rhizorhapis sp. SPR117]
MMGWSIRGWKMLAMVLLVQTVSCSAQPVRKDVLERAAGPPSTAFPGAIGYGAASKGGRGGRMLFVTTLDDSGPGSYRACVEAHGPRTCIFRVGGLIRFTGKPPVIRNPYLTIAGQTAPGEGITLAHSGGVDGFTPVVVKKTHDVIIRNIRVRIDRPGFDQRASDAFTIEDSHDVILDHVSGSWAADELVNPYGDNDNITISWSLFAEGMPKHDKCALLGSDPKGPQHISFIGNLCAHNGDRNPDVNFPPGSCVEVINNVLYNAQSQFTEIWESYGGSPVAVVGNVLRAGPNTREQAIGIDHVTIGSTGPAQIYVHDNKFDGMFQHFAADLDKVRVAQPPCPLTVKPAPATEAYDRVLDAAGVFPRDAFDTRIVSEVKSRTGRLKKTPGTIEVGEDDEYDSPYPDADGDGMDDEWEIRNGADPDKIDSWLDANGDGLSNFDTFLDYLQRLKMGVSTA